jgi:hypothetical protein
MQFMMRTIAQQSAQFSMTDGLLKLESEAAIILFCSVGGKYTVFQEIFCACGAVKLYHDL